LDLVETMYPGLPLNTTTPNFEDTQGRSLWVGFAVSNFSV